jgi:hypothetical protein
VPSEFGYWSRHPIASHLANSPSFSTSLRKARRSSCRREHFLASRMKDNPQSELQLPNLRIGTRGYLGSSEKTPKLNPETDLLYVLSSECVYTHMSHTRVSSSVRIATRHEEINIPRRALAESQFSTIGTHEADMIWKEPQ